MSLSDVEEMNTRLLYNQWVRQLGVPVLTGHYVSDLKNIELGWWEERKCNVAFIQLAGMNGVSEARVTEIPPGESLPPLKFSLGETVYVVSGQGSASIWYGDGQRKTFEWQPRSMFHIPRNSYHQLYNGRGDEPARLLQYNYLPMALTVLPDLDFFFDNKHESASAVIDLSGEDTPRAVLGAGSTDEYAVENWGATRDESLPPTAYGLAWWIGNFFPDMGVWDKLSPLPARGAGGHGVRIMFPGSGMTASMSVFDVGLYKKAHLHGPGRVIVIPAGEGYTLLWPPGGEKVMCPWNEASVFTPPGGWFHQHFNVGGEPARYLKFGHLPQLAGHARQVIEYPDEDADIRETFENQLSERDRTSAMPAQAYEDRGFKWSYRKG